MTRGCVDAIAETIAHDTGYRAEEAQLLSIGLTGLMEVSARWWLTSPDRIPKERAVELLLGLAWRGISGSPARRLSASATSARVPPSADGRGRLRGPRTSVSATHRPDGQESSVEVKIGVQFAPRELEPREPQSPDEVAKAVADALRADLGVLTLVDEKGRRVLVPADKLAYVEIAENEQRRVGFAAL